jgi:hypothetical protein
VANVAGESASAISVRGPAGAARIGGRVAAPGLAGQLGWLIAAMVTGVSVAGFWNVQAVDGLGVAVFVSPVVGPFEGRSAEFAVLGPGFGFLFAVAAGLAATLTASNVASFTLLPLLAFVLSGAPSRAAAFRLIGVTAVTVALVGAIYGAFIGRLGPAGAAAFNVSAIRGPQSFVVFSALGLVMLFWAALESGLLARLIRRPSPVTRVFLAQSTVRAATAGLVIGAFSLGRPLAVFRELLLYAAQPSSVSYGAVVVATQALGNVAVPAAVLALVIACFRARIAGWARAWPRVAATVSASTLGGGGAFLLFYWGITRVWPSLGRWGFQLGLYQ